MILLSVRLGGCDPVSSLISNPTQRHLPSLFSGNGKPVGPRQAWELERCLHSRAEHSSNLSIDFLPFIPPNSLSHTSKESSTMGYITTFLHSQLFVKLPYPNYDFSNQTIIVTGANTGLGNLPSASSLLQPCLTASLSLSLRPRGRPPLPAPERFQSNPRRPKHLQRRSRRRLPQHLSRLLQIPH